MKKDCNHAVLCRKCAFIMQQSVTQQSLFDNKMVMIFFFIQLIWKKKISCVAQNKIPP